MDVVSDQLFSVVQRNIFYICPIAALCHGDEWRLNSFSPYMCMSVGRGGSVANSIIGYKEEISTVVEVGKKTQASIKC